jgi:putative ABC transport system permease protein
MMRRAAPAAVITHGYWLRRFNGDATAVGAHLLVEGINVPIIGVTPASFNGTTVGDVADITLAISARPRLQPENDGFLSASSRWLRLLARPTGGTTRQQLQAALDTAWRPILESTLPSGINLASRARTLTMTVSVAPGDRGTSRIRQSFRAPLTTAMALVALVLVMACVNIANLLLARAAIRSRELALRLAIGAGRSRIFRQLLTESALLAALGTIIGVAMSVAGSDALVALIASNVSGPEADLISLDVTLNWRVGAAASAIMVATTVLFGVAPAYRASVTARHTISIGSIRHTAAHRRFATGLIVTHVALSLAIVAGAGLFARSLHHLRALDCGFRTEDVLLVSFDPRREHPSPPALRAFNHSCWPQSSVCPACRRQRSPPPLHCRAAG